MMKPFVTDVFGDKGRLVQWLIKPALGLVLLAVAAGCQTQPPILTPTKQTTNVTEVIILREGDVLKISFPSSANLNTTQPIRRDGMISMPLVGEVKAVGKTPEELKKDLIDLYSTQLMSKEVMVEVQSSLFPVYVTGSVLRPGKIMSDHPMTAFEAIMEAGGFDYAKANLKKVVVIRQKGDHGQKYTLNLKLVMKGEGGEPFYLKPGDTIFVPERFSWF
jgi:polysaccharide export outer membrane protein